MPSRPRRATSRRAGALAPAFLGAFRDVLLADRALAANLRGAAHGAVLRPWTELLTAAVAGACLWKVASVKAPLAGLFCFRRRPEEIPLLVARLGDEALRRLPAPSGELLVVAGTRSAAETFPDGYFRPFAWDAELGRLHPSVFGGAPG